MWDNFRFDTLKKIAALALSVFSITVGCRLNYQFSLVTRAQTWNFRQEEQSSLILMLKIYTHNSIAHLSLFEVDPQCFAFHLNSCHLFQTFWKWFPIFGKAGGSLKHSAALHFVSRGLMGKWIPWLEGGGRRRRRWGKYSFRISRENLPPLPFNWLIFEMLMRPYHWSSLFIAFQCLKQSWACSR